jgi:hypothetical protein
MKKRQAIFINGVLLYILYVTECILLGDNQDIEVQEDG